AEACAGRRARPEHGRRRSGRAADTPGRLLECSSLRPVSPRRPHDFYGARSPPDHRSFPGGRPSRRASHPLGCAPPSGGGPTRGDLVPPRTSRPRHLAQKGHAVMRRTIRALGSALLMLSITTAAAFASSHSEAPGTAKDRLADDTDLYAFVSPD